MSVTTSGTECAAQIHQILDRIIVREECVLSYDKTLVDLLPHILRENYGIENSSQIHRLKPLGELYETLNVTAEDVSINDLPALLVEAGVDQKRYCTRTDDDNGAEFKNFSTATHEDNVEAVLTLQCDLGQGKHKEGDEAYDPNLLKPENVKQYLDWVTTPPPSYLEKLFKSNFWEMQIRKWKLFGQLDSNLPSLSVGGRWLTEILYFRQVHGLTQHIGLDLHSGDEDLVKVGDMHAMPFDDDQFGFVFIKNTFDKSYDVRKLVSELLRVTRRNGIIAVDQVCDYGWTSSLGRTDIQRAQNLLKVFRSQAACKSLVCTDVDITGIGDVAQTSGSSNNARLAIKVKKAK